MRSWQVLGHFLHVSRVSPQHPICVGNRLEGGTGQNPCGGFAALSVTAEVEPRSHDDAVAHIALLPYMQTGILKCSEETDTVRFPYSAWDCCEWL